MEIRVKQKILDEASELYSAVEITENKPVKGFYNFRGDQFVVTGGLHYQGCKRVTMYPVVPIEKYTGSLQPLYYSYHQIEINQGNRERSYKGMIIRYKKHEYVIVDKSWELILEGYQD